MIYTFFPLKLSEKRSMSVSTNAKCLSPLQARTTCLLRPRVHILGRYKQTLPGHCDCGCDLCHDGDYVDDDCVIMTKPGV